MGVQNLAYYAFLFVSLNLILIFFMVGSNMSEFIDLFLPFVQPQLPPFHEAVGRHVSTSDCTEGLLSGQTALVTGSNRGLGYAIAQQLLVHGATVILGVRSGGPQLVERMAAEVGVPRERIRLEKVDLSDPGSIVELTTRLQNTDTQIQLLVLNAALVDVEFKPSPTCSNVSRMYTVNYLANVVLFRELQDRQILSARPSANACTSPAALPRPRVVYVSSGTYASGSTDFFGAHSRWSMLEAVQQYGQTKFLTQAWAMSVAKKLEGKVDIVSYNPGPVDTEIGTPNVPSALLPTYYLMKRVFFLSPWDAAEPLLHVIPAFMTAPSSSGVYLHIRETRPLEDLVMSAKTHDWLSEHTEAALNECGYSSP